MGTATGKTIGEQNPEWQPGDATLTVGGVAVPRVTPSDALKIASDVEGVEPVAHRLGWAQRLRGVTLDVYGPADSSGRYYLAIPDRNFYSLGLFERAAWTIPFIAIGCQMGRALAVRTVAA